jgi:outer membrane protein insertion porin family
VDLEIEGNRSVDSAIILGEIHTNKGKAYNRELVGQDTKRVYRLGFFEEVTVDKVPVPGGVKLIFRVMERPPIAAIVIEGNKKIKKDKILEVITVRAGQVPDNAKIAESKKKITSLYSDEGYSDAMVETEIRTVDNKRELVFRINEKEGRSVKAVDFEGNTVFSDRKLRGMVRTKKKNILSFLTGSGKFREETLEQDEALLTYNYLNKGYMRVRVGKPKIEYSEKKNGIILTYSIDEGQQYRIGDVTLEGEVITTKEEILSRFNTLKGNVYSQKILEEDLTKVHELYGNQGYAFANVFPQPMMNDETLTADIVIKIEKGQKVFIEQINITGNTITRDKVIRREMRVVENSIYNEKLLKLSKQKLEQLGYFESVEVATPRGSQDDRLVLNLNVKEKPTGTFSIGAGYSSAESFLFTASVAKNNFFGLGISGNVSAEISGRRQQFSASLTDPYFLDTRNIFSANAYRISTDFEDFRRQSFGGGVTLGRRLFDFTAISMGYQIEDVQLNEFDLIVPIFFTENASGLSSSLVFSMNRDTRNNPLVTTKGSYLSVDMQYSGNGLGGDVDFFRVMGNARFFFPVWKGSVFRFNARAGWIKSLSGEPVPLFERFFTGGINSLRGYELRSVGPAITIPGSITGADEEFVYGGDKLLVFNVEYEFPIYNQGGFRGVVFFDAGNAFAEDQTFNPINLRADFGAGIRWVSPFGPLRFEWGFPINRQPDEKRSVFNFTIGSFF